MLIAEINTSQNVIIQYEVSPLRDRILAFIIDIVIVFAVITLLTALISMAFSYPGVNYLLYIIPGSFFVFYTLLSEIFMDGQTLGKKGIGIKTIRLDGKEMGLSDHMVRWTFRMIDIYLSVGAIGTMMISSTEKNQRLGNILSNTIVIKKNPSMSFNINDILNIKSVQQRTPKYPLVARLKEKDILLIKDVLERAKKYPNEAHKRAVDDLCNKLVSILEIDQLATSKLNFLKVLIDDYVVLSR